MLDGGAARRGQKLRRFRGTQPGSCFAYLRRDDTVPRSCAWTGPIGREEC
jgi:hypothetical protein